MGSKVVFFIVLCISSFSNCIDGVGSPSVNQNHLRLRTLDISNPNKYVFKTYHFEYDDVPTVMFLAKRESKVRKIVDGKNIIWVSDKYHHCTQVLVHLNGMTPALAQITLETRLNTVVLRVRNVCGFWEATPYFAELFVGLKVPSILNVKFPMDIWLREDNEHMRVLYYEIYKVPSIVMVPRTGHNSGKVVDRRRRIWKTKKSKRILCLKLHPSDDPVLLHIVTMSMSGKVKNKYFARQSNGNWEVINKYGYLRMLHDELRAQVLRDTVQDLEEDSEDEEEEEEEEKKKEPEVEEQLLIIL